jgi:hypothetical protein
MTVFWNVAPCRLVEVYRLFRGAYYLHHQSDEMEAVSTSEASVNFYQTTRRNIPEKSSSYSPPWEPVILPAKVMIGFESSADVIYRRVMRGRLHKYWRGKGWRESSRGIFQDSILEFALRYLGKQRKISITVTDSPVLIRTKYFSKFSSRTS